MFLKPVHGWAGRSVGRLAGPRMWLAVAACVAVSSLLGLSLAPLVRQSQPMPLMVVHSGMPTASSMPAIPPSMAVRVMSLSELSHEQTERSELPQNPPQADSQAPTPQALPPQAIAEVDLQPAAAFSLSAQAEANQPLMFNHRPLRHVRTIRMRVTAYSPDARSCGQWADGFTASGYSVWTNGMCLVAADTSLLPFGSIVTVPGYDSGRPVPVLDRGGAIKGHRLDVLMPTHRQAMQWGVQYLEVDIWEYADE